MRKKIHVRPSHAQKTADPLPKSSSWIEPKNLGIVFIVVAIGLICNYFTPESRQDAVIYCLRWLESLLEDPRLHLKRPPIPNFSQLNISVVSAEFNMKRKWRSGGRFLREVVKEALPIIITEAPTALWPILNWNLLDISKPSQPQIWLNGTRWQPKEPVFVLGQDREKGGMLGDKGDRPIAYINATLSNFLLSTLDPGEYMYWTGDLEQWETTLSRNGTTSAANSSILGWKSLKVRTLCMMPEWARQFLLEK